MAGIYIHIPFCKQACSYCNFYFTTQHQHIPALVQALCTEAEIQKNYLQNQTINTIYFGGGTPSVLSTTQLNTILNALYKNYTISPHPEITLEANPDDLNPQKLKELSQTPINRLSIGIQSFNPNHLKWMHRSHTAQQATDCVINAQNVGLSNINIDLIYGIPTMSLSQWQQNLHIAQELNTQHWSCYALTVEEKTLLHTQIKKGLSPAIPDALAAQHFAYLQQYAQQNGYLHYEISNLAKPNFESQHNTNYWQGVPYLGLGPAAHSYKPHQRQWNIANLNQYIEGVNNNTLNFEREELSPKNQYNETVMTKLRMLQGINLTQLQAQFNKTPHPTEFEKHINNGLLTLQNNTLQLTQQGMFFADGIASDMFWID